jgi:hypothetical protein
MKAAIVNTAPTIVATSETFLTDMTQNSKQLTVHNGAGRMNHLSREPALNIFFEF